MNIKYTHTNGKNQDFVYLCSELDNALNELAGGFDNRSQYVEHNQLDDIHDVYIAYEGYAPIGCASFKQFEDGIAEAKRVYVSSGHRGKGIAKKLMELIEVEAKKQGFHTMILETGRKMSVANGLYKNLGYSIMPNYGVYETMEASICFSKKL